MQIKDPQLTRDIAQGRPIKLNLGSGGGAGERDGFYGVDIRDAPGVSVVCDLERGLPLPDACVEMIYSSHFFEHVRDLTSLMRECQRLLQKGGRMDITVPHFSCPHFYSDPTHVRFFGLHTMNYFAAPGGHKGSPAPRYEPDIRFIVDRVSIELMPRSLLERLTTPFLQDWINRDYAALDRYERRFCWLAPAYTVRYELTVDK
jgi:SAM-dependent methyltransferase